MKPISLLTTLLLAIAVGANSIVVQKPFVTLPISKRFNVTSTQGLLQHSQIQARAFRAKREAKAAGTALYGDGGISLQLENQAIAYIASVGVGSPATFYDLVVDTGSANTWIGAGKAYVQTNTSIKTNSSVHVDYDWISFNGTEFIDQVTLATGLVIPKQSIGVASITVGSEGVDGIIGIGPTSLTAGTLTPDTGLIPTVIDNLFWNGAINTMQFGISFEPITSASGTEVNGEITWGGIDYSKFTGEITYTPITTTSPSKEVWSIEQSITYGNTTILSTTAGIVDTGTTLIYLATDAFDAYQAATGGVFDSNFGLLRVTSAQFANLQTLSFIISGKSFDLTPNAQIWPRNLNAMVGGIASGIYLMVSNLGAPSGSGLDFVNGQAFLERFYSVFDTANRRVGFATTPFTTAITN